MGMMPQNKKLASLIVGDVKSPEEPIVDADIGINSAAEKVMASFEAKDSKMLVSAMRDLFSMLYDQAEMSETEE